MANDTLNINVTDTIMGAGVTIGTADKVAGWVFNIDVVNSYVYLGVMVLTGIAAVIKLHDTWPNSRLKKFLSKKKKSKKMITTFDEIVEKVLGHEAAYTDNPKDSGNWTGGVPKKGELKGTKYGISAKAYPNEDIKNLNLTRARELYYQDYWLPSKSGSIAPHLRHLHFDTAVNCGVGKAAELLQKACGVVADKKIGEKTIAATLNCHIQNYALQKVNYYYDIVLRRPKDLAFIRGWYNRLVDVVSVVDGATANGIKAACNEKLKTLNLKLI